MRRIQLQPLADLGQPSDILVVRQSKSGGIVERVEIVLRHLRFRTRQRKEADTMGNQNSELSLLNCKSGSFRSRQKLSER